MPAGATAAARTMSAGSNGQSSTGGGTGRDDSFDHNATRVACGRTGRRTIRRGVPPSSAWTDAAVVENTVSAGGVASRNAPGAAASEPSHKIAAPSRRAWRTARIRASRAVFGSTLGPSNAAVSTIIIGICSRAASCVARVRFPAPGAPVITISIPAVSAQTNAVIASSSAGYRQSSARTVEGATIRTASPSRGSIESPEVRQLVTNGSATQLAVTDHGVGWGSSGCASFQRTRPLSGPSRVPGFHWNSWLASHGVGSVAVASSWMKPHIRRSHGSASTATTSVMRSSSGSVSASS
jgi:hypothetical protein